MTQMTIAETIFKRKKDAREERTDEIKKKTKKIQTIKRHLCKSAHRHRENESQDALIKSTAIATQIILFQ